MDQTRRSGLDRRGRREPIESDTRTDLDRRGSLRHNNQLVEVLRKIPLFKGLSLLQFKTILNLCSKRTFCTDEVLCKMGDEAFEFFILLRGSLKVTFKDGKEISRINPIGSVGEMGVFTGDRRSATIIAAEDSLLLSIHKAELIRAFHDDADLAIRVLMNVINDLSGKIRQDNSLIEDLRRICPPGQWTRTIREAENR
jgi:CRP-like cAMP-binding protein